MSSDGAGFASPRVFLPFAALSVIWGSTWIVILDQLGAVPPSWSVTYRFLVAMAAMFAYALATRTDLRIGRGGHGFSFVFGLLQFSLNFNLVYLAEGYITSGLVAVSFGALVVTNALLGRLFLGLRFTGAFVLGSGIAMAGIALLFYNECRVMPAGADAVLTGLLYTVIAILVVSVANVMQASKRARALPMPSLLAWGMFYGVALNALWAWLADGPPTVEYRLGYFAGVLYLGGLASAIAFPLYFGLIRIIGPARAAYTGVVTPVLAMLLSTLFEDYRWSGYAVAGGVLAISGLVIALRGRERPPAPQPFGREG